MNIRKSSQADIDQIEGIYDRILYEEEAGKVVVNESDSNKQGLYREMQVRRNNSETVARRTGISTTIGRWFTGQS